MALPEIITQIASVHKPNLSHTIINGFVVENVPRSYDASGRLDGCCTQ